MLSSSFARFFNNRKTINYISMMTYFTGNPLDRSLIPRTDTCKHISMLSSQSHKDSVKVIFINSDGNALYQSSSSGGVELGWMNASEARILLNLQFPDPEISMRSVINGGTWWQVKGQYSIFYLGGLLESHYYGISLESEKFSINDFGGDASDRMTGVKNFKPNRPNAFAIASGDKESGILAQALSLANWHQRYKFCGNCGHPTISLEAGSKRACQNTLCNINGFIAGEKSNPSNFWFPRTDPVIITIISDKSENFFLLGRGARHPAGVYSCIAGFMEPGESVADACKREAMEETGIPLARTEIILDQPWPFPCSLMLGCFSWTDFDYKQSQQQQKTISSHEPILADAELQDAKWFPRNLVLAALENSVNTELRLPPSYTIAHRLFSKWFIDH